MAKNTKAKTKTTEQTATPDIVTTDKDISSENESLKKQMEEMKAQMEAMTLLKRKAKEVKSFMDVIIILNARLLIGINRLGKAVQNVELCLQKKIIKLNAVVVIIQSRFLSTFFIVFFNKLIIA